MRTICLRLSNLQSISIEHQLPNPGHPLHRCGLGSAQLLRDTGIDLRLHVPVNPLRAHKKARKPEESRRYVIKTVHSLRGDLEAVGVVVVLPMSCPSTQSSRTTPHFGLMGYRRF